MKFLTKFTKFPYVFWSFGKTYECVKSQNEIHCNGKIYNFKPMSKALFLILKYLPVAIIFFFLLTKYDFSLERERLISYLCAILVFLAFFYLENLIRTIAVIVILALSFAIGAYLGMFSLVAFVLKYAIILFCFFMFFIDLKFNAYMLIQNGKIVSHFLTKEKL
nr:hypothetical protein [Campylobacter sp.]